MVVTAPASITLHFPLHLIEELRVLKYRGAQITIAGTETVKERTNLRLRQGRSMSPIL